MGMCELMLLAINHWLTKRVFCMVSGVCEGGHRRFRSAYCQGQH